MMEIKKGEPGLLALAVMSLLGERPMHPYEISAVMQQRQLSAVIKLNNSSLYSVKEALQRAGLIVPVETQREGRYPERTVYAITEAGQAELSAWLRALLSRPATEYTQFAAALAFLGNLTPVEVMVLLTEHAGHLQEEAGSMRSAIERGLKLGVDRLFLVEDTYALALLEARLTFMRQLIQDINAGTLTELREGKRIWKISRPDLALLESDMEKGRGAAGDLSGREEVIQLVKRAGEGTCFSHCEVCPGRARPG